MLIVRVIGYLETDLGDASNNNTENDSLQD